MLSGEEVDGAPLLWAPAIHPPDSLAHLIGDLDFRGYHYGWELAPNADGGTDITHTYDWSGVKDDRTLQFFPRVSSDQMAETINRLGQAARPT
jgi:hypothetical protein